MYRTNKRALCPAAILAFLLVSSLASANAHRSAAWANSQFEIAEHKRQLLQAQPSQPRHAYQDVINAYRRVYFGRPNSPKADASVFAVADLMAEMGRRFHDPSLPRSAITQYQFLRREYPGSKYRIEALYKIAQLYRDDLRDEANARKAFQDFVGRYPSSNLAGDARAALAKPPENKIGLEQPEVSRASGLHRHDPPDSATSAKQNPPPVSPPYDDEKENKAGNSAHVTGISYHSYPGHTRVEIAVDQDIDFSSQRIDSPDRILFDLDAKLPKKLIGKDFDVNDDLLAEIRTSQAEPARARIVLEVGEHSDFYSSMESNPLRLVIDLRDSRAKTQAGHNSNNLGPYYRAPQHVKGSQAATLGNPTKRIIDAEADAQPEDEADDVSSAGQPPPSATAKTAPSPETSRNRPNPLRKANIHQVSVREAQPTANGDRSLIRALGLKIGKIVIDPGHGGYDTGTIGPHSLAEKDVVLDVSRRLGKLLESRLGAQVVYTRKDDTFVPLETRTAIANQERADLFVSIHANSSHDPAARGVETYYLNFSSSPDALEVAARENAVSETSIHELQDLVKQIALKEKIEESREFASDVQEELHNGLAAKNAGLRNRGVKKAPFIVLIGANMPSILAEISFVSNPGDERRLETSAYRQKIAESLYRGISRYVSGLSGVKVASKIEKTSVR